MGNLEVGIWTIGILLYFVLCVKAGVWAYNSAWKFTGAPDNVVAPPPTMLSSGQTNPHVEPYRPTSITPIPWVNSDQFSTMSNVCVQYMEPMQNRIYDQRR